MSKDSRNKKRVQKQKQLARGTPPRSPDHLPPQTSRSLTLTKKTTEFSGPIPPPETLAKYDEVLEGAANRIITEFEKQSAHRRGMESSLVTSETRDKVFGRLLEFSGQCFALGAMLSVLAGGVYLATGEGIDSKIVGACSVARPLSES